MKFKDEYKKEMDCIKHDTNLDELILKSSNVVITPKKHFSLKKCSAIAGVALSLVVIANFSNISSFADNLFGKFRLSTVESRSDMDDLKPVDFDMERFSSFENVTRNDTDGISYFINGIDTDTLNESTGIKLPKCSDVIFSDISISVSETYRNGHLSMYVSDGNDITTHMNGQFLINGSDSSQFLGYGYDTGKIENEYICKNGSKAYYIKENEMNYDKNHLVMVFCANDIQYQLFIDDTYESIEFSKNVANSLVS